ncbi:MAG: hypothetical protein WDW38_003777 [Sanguina aurantia]
MAEYETSDGCYSEDSYSEADLVQALSLLRQSRSENAELKRNFESLKSIHVQLNNTHGQLQAKHSALYEERINVERQYQSLCESWRMELEEKQKQFDSVKAQLLQPRDLELLKLQMLQEVEEPWERKCEMLAREAETSQESFVRVRRAYEEVLANNSNVELRHASEASALRAEHSGSLKDMKERMALLAAANGEEPAVPRSLTC